MPAAGGTEEGVREDGEQEEMAMDDKEEGVREEEEIGRAHV